MPRFPLRLAPLLCLTLAACAETPGPTPASLAPETARAAAQPATPSATPAADAAAPRLQAPSFADWLHSFRARALQQGVDAQLFDAVFAGMTPDPAVIRADQSQPEFTRPVWEYLDGALSPTRIRRGKELLAEHRSTLDAIEARYGVDRQFLVAIWGMESNFGQFMGDKSVIRSLATLAHEGRRPAFAEQQLLAALQILGSGDISARGMLGSWAGAMGQTQFIPTTYLSHAVDFDGNGRRDIWGSPADALASAAHYLQASGWQKGRAWGIRVALPGGFDYALADTGIRKTYEQWAALGVKGQPTRVSPQETGYLLLPAGHRGPAFLVFGNFAAILKYNNSSSYALAVGLLGERLAGSAPFTAQWPKDERPLSRSERLELQERLLAKGFEPGTPDAIIGANTRRAIRAFQQQLGWPADGHPTPQLLEALRR